MKTPTPLNIWPQFSIKWQEIISVQKVSTFHKIFSISDEFFNNIKDMTMDYGKGAAGGSGGGSVLKIVNDLAKGSKMPTVNI